MNTTHSIHAEMMFAISIWASLMIIVHVTAAWRSRVMPHANAPPSLEQTKVAETLCGPRAETMMVSQPASPISRTSAPSKPAAAAKPRKSIPEEVAVTGPYEFYEWL